MNNDSIFTIEGNGNINYKFKICSTGIWAKLKKLCFMIPLIILLSGSITVNVSNFTMQVGGVQIIQPPTPQTEKSPEVKPDKKTKTKK